MVPEDRVARTMDLQEDIAAKMEILAKNAATELELLPQGMYFAVIIIYGKGCCLLKR
jgi:hypothetical protein